MSKNLDFLCLDFLAGKKSYLNLVLAGIERVSELFAQRPEELTKIICRTWATWLSVMDRELDQYLQNGRVAAEFPTELMVAGLDLTKINLPASKLVDNMPWKKLFATLIDLETVYWLDQLKTEDDVQEWTSEFRAIYLQSEENRHRYEKLRELRANDFEKLLKTSDQSKLFSELMTLKQMISASSIVERIGSCRIFLREVLGRPLLIDALGKSRHKRSSKGDDGLLRFGDPDSGHDTAERKARVASESQQDNSDDNPRQAPTTSEERDDEVVLRKTSRKKRRKAAHAIAGDGILDGDNDIDEEQSDDAEENMNASGEEIEGSDESQPAPTRLPMDAVAELWKSSEFGGISFDSLGKNEYVDLQSQLAEQKEPKKNATQVIESSAKRPPSALPDIKDPLVQALDATSKLKGRERKRRLSDSQENGAEVTWTSKATTTDVTSEESSLKQEDGGRVEGGSRKKMPAPPPERKKREAGKMPSSRLPPVRKTGVYRRTGRGVSFTPEEDRDLISGLRSFGWGKWAQVLKAGKFLQVRTAVSLKDRARSMRLNKADYM